MGGTAAGTGVCGGEELSGDGSAGGAVDGEVVGFGGSAGAAEGSGGDEAWGVFGVDWWVFLLSLPLSGHDKVGMVG